MAFDEAQASYREGGIPVLYSVAPSLVNTMKSEARHTDGGPRRFRSELLSLGQMARYSAAATTCGYRKETRSCT